MLKKKNQFCRAESGCSHVLIAYLKDSIMISLVEMHTLSVLRGSSQYKFLRVCNLIPVAHIIPAELKGDRE